MCQACRRPVHGAKLGPQVRIRGKVFDAGSVVAMQVGKVGHARSGLVLGADAVRIGSDARRRKNRGCRCIGSAAFVGDGSL